MAEDLLKQIEVLKNELKLQNNRLEEYKKNNFVKKFNISRDTPIFVETLTSKGIIRSYTGYFLYESQDHIVINIFDFKGDFNYIINKKMIIKTENIIKKQIMGLKTYYGGLKKGWKVSKDINKENKK